MSNNSPINPPPVGGFPPFIPGVPDPTFPWLNLLSPLFSPVFGNPYLQFTPMFPPPLPMMTPMINPIPNITKQVLAFEESQTDTALKTPTPTPPAQPIERIQKCPSCLQKKKKMSLKNKLKRVTKSLMVKHKKYRGRKMSRMDFNKISYKLDLEPIAVTTWWKRQYSLLPSSEWFNQWQVAILERQFVLEDMYGFESKNKLMAKKTGLSEQLVSKWFKRRYSEEEEKSDDNEDC